MNHIQLILFLFFVGSAFISGVAIYTYIGVNRSAVAKNRAIYFSETIILGSAFIYGLFMLLSMVHLYTKEFLFVAVAVNYLLLLRQDIRRELNRFWIATLPSSITFYVFAVILFVFIFRNYYFQVNIDSHISYLAAQKLWLLNQTSILGSAVNDIRIFNPHFEDILAALGISFYPNELLYPQLINILFRVITILLVYGYTTYRLGSFYGLAASLFVMFNLHFYVSGANRWILMNGMLIALFFSAAYNFYESYRKADTHRFFLAIIFLMLFPCNKYQSLYILLLCLVMGLWIQPSLKKIFDELFVDRRKLVVLGSFFEIASLYFIKNWIATGWPFFPLFSSHLNIFNRDIQMEQVFNQVHRGVNWIQLLNYNGFLFLWHGMRPAWWIFISFFFLPIILLGILKNKNIPTEETKEFAFWLAMSFFGICGMCLASHQDPRQYVFVLGILSFSAVYVWHYILTHLFRLQNRLKIIAQLLILVYSAQGASILIPHKDTFDLPTFQDNIGVLTDKIHTADILARYFPYTNMINEAFRLHPEIMAKSAYTYYIGTTDYSLFLVPPRPIIGLFFTSLVKWKSYEKIEWIVEDLKKHDIQSVIDIRDNHMVMLSPEEFAQQEIKRNRFPPQTLQEYGFPPELKDTDYRRILNK